MSGFTGVSSLSAAEVRVLGCLLEKQRTTPDAYPLTLNALRLACNQATNRDPVVDYDDTVIREALHRLERRGHVRLASGRGSRAPKYRHLLADTLPLSSGEQALLCVLMLRGPQTPGELKQRAERMHVFSDLEAVLAALGDLGERGLVERLGRRPGQKEDRFAQLLEEDAEAEHQETLEPGSAGPGIAGEQERHHEPTALSASAPTGPGAPAATSLAELERRVTRLERELAELRERAASREQTEVPEQRNRPEQNELPQHTDQPEQRVQQEQNNQSQQIPAREEARLPR